MNEEQFKALRAPFPPSQVGKLPRVTCRNCRDMEQKVCDRHTKSKCTTCDNYITVAHIHLDFVGHADLTDRLLDVDPEWTWDPMGRDQSGAPAIDSIGGLWIRLTVAGVTRIGYGHPDGKRGGDAMKETIGDALRNAAMRFGVALDLWRKEPAHADEARSAPTPPDRQSSAAPKPPTQADQARQTLREVCTEMGLDMRQVAAAYETTYGTGLREEPDPTHIAAFTIDVRQQRIHLEPGGAS